MNRVEAMGWKPRNCVWELTLACNLRCGHCGSRAGKVRPKEMSLDECLGVVDQLADMGCELVTLSGGEPTLKKGWDTIASAIHARGIYVNMVTNGAYGSADKAKAVAPLNSKSPARALSPITANTNGFGNGIRGTPWARRRKPANATRARGRPPCFAVGISGRKC